MAGRANQAAQAASAWEASGSNWGSLAGSRKAKNLEASEENEAGLAKKEVLATQANRVTSASEEMEGGYIDSRNYPFVGV